MLSAEMLETRQRRFGRWTAATVLVVALHFGGAAIALYTWPTEIEDEASGAIAIELAPLTATTDATPDDLALGRPAEEATPTPALSRPEKSEEHEAEETPVVDQSPAREPEVAVPISKPEEKKPDEKKKEDVKKEKAEEFLSLSSNRRCKLRRRRRRRASRKPTLLRPRLRRPPVRDGAPNPQKPS